MWSTKRQESHTPSSTPKLLPLEHTIRCGYHTQVHRYGLIICEAISQVHKHHPGQDYFRNLFSVYNRVRSLFSAVPATKLPIVILHTALLADYAVQFCQFVLVIKMEDVLREYLLQYLGHEILEEMHRDIR